MEELEQSWAEAIYDSNLGKVQKLIETSANINIIQNKSGRTLLIAAIYSENSLAVARLLLESEADVNLKDREGYTPIYRAVGGWKNTELVRLLLNYQADVSTEKNAPHILLFEAIRYYNLDVIKLLIEAGIDINIQENTTGRTPISLAIFFSNTELAKFLLQNNIQIPDITNLEILLKEFYTNYLEDRTGDEVDIGLVKLFSSFIFSNNFLNWWGYVMKYGQQFCEKIEELFAVCEETEVNSYYLEIIGPKYLLNAIGSNDIEKVSHLINLGVNINALLDKRNTTPLIAAINSQNDDTEDLIKNLLDAGADVNLADVNSTPVYYAMQSSNNIEKLELLLEYGVDLSAQRYYPYSLLVEAIRENDLEATELLINAGIDVNIKERKEPYDTPLSAAIVSRNEKFVELLLESPIREITDIYEIRDLLNQFYRGYLQQGIVNMELAQLFTNFIFNGNFVGWYHAYGSELGEEFCQQIFEIFSPYLGEKKKSARSVHNQYITDNQDLVEGEAIAAIEGDQKIDVDVEVLGQGGLETAKITELSE